MPWRGTLCPKKDRGAGGLFGLDESARNGQAGVTSSRIPTDTAGGGRELSPPPGVPGQNLGPFGSCCGCGSPACQSSAGHEVGPPGPSAPFPLREPWTPSGPAGISGRLRDGPEELGCWALAEGRRDVAPLGRPAASLPRGWRRVGWAGLGSSGGGWGSPDPLQAGLGSPGRAAGGGAVPRAPVPFLVAPVQDAGLPVLSRGWPDTTRLLPTGGPGAARLPSQGERQDRPGCRPGARRLPHRSPVPSWDGVLDLPRGSLWRVTWPEGAAASLGSAARRVLGDLRPAPRLGQGRCPREAGHSPRERGLCTDDAASPPMEGFPTETTLQLQGRREGEPGRLSGPYKVSELLALGSLGPTLPPSTI